MVVLIKQNSRTELTKMNDNIIKEKISQKKELLTIEHDLRYNLITITHPIPSAIIYFVYFFPCKRVLYYHTDESACL